MHIDGSDNIKTTHELVLKQFHISVNKKIQVRPAKHTCKHTCISMASGLFWQRGLPPKRIKWSDQTQRPFNNLKNVYM
jgi:hypothetical protein